MTDDSKVAKRQRKFRFYRAIKNMWWLFVVVILVLNVARLFGPQAEEAAGLLWIPFGLLMLAWGPLWVILSAGFLYGWVRCPLCDKSFGRRWMWANRTCSNCHRDVLVKPEEARTT